MINRLRHFYQSNPRVANALSGLITFGGGDFISQNLAGELNDQSQSRSIDSKRILDVALFGAGMNGITLFSWYKSLDYIFGKSMTSKSTVLLKCTADQLLYAPFSIIAYFSFAALRNGGTSDEVLERLRVKVENSFLNAWIADCVVWPFVNILNFSIIPLYYRPTFVGIAQLGWLSYLSFVSNSGLNKSVD